MTTTAFHISIRFFLCLLVASHLVSCATSSALNSRTRHVGSAHAIKECRADSQRAYIVWQVEKDGPTETIVLDLKTRNSAPGKRPPPSATWVPVIALSGETAAIPKAQPLPCLVIWRARSDIPDGPFAPRVRWVGRDRDFCVNLPAMAPEPGAIASRVPLAVVQDAFMLGILAVTLPGKAAAPLLQTDPVDLDAREMVETLPTALENALEDQSTATLGRSVE